MYQNDNNLKNINQDKTNINNGLTQKVKLKAENSDDDGLKSLVSQRNEYESSLKQNSEYISADRSGIVSYRVDGMEEDLKTDDFSYLSEEYLENLDVQAGQIIATSSNTGKIIDNFKCYIACLSDSEEARSAEIGNSIKIRLQTTEEIPAKIVYKAIQDDEKELLVLEISNCVTQLVQYRKTAFDIIWWSSTGLKIPNTALKYDGDVAYVIRDRGGLKEKIYIKVLKSNEKYSIVENYTYSELEKLGYDSETLQYKKSISVYDEIEN